MCGCRRDRDYLYYSGSLHKPMLWFDPILYMRFDILLSLSPPPLSHSTTHIIVTSLELKLSCPTPALMDRTQPTSYMMKLGHRPVCVFSRFQLHWTDPPQSAVSSPRNPSTCLQPSTINMQMILSAKKTVPDTSSASTLRRAGPVTVDTGIVLTLSFCYNHVGK